MGDLSQNAMQILCQEKYFALKRRCEEVQQANEKLVNRIYNVKKIIKRYKCERSVLMTKLDELGDDYQEALVPAFMDEGAGGSTSHDDDDNNMAASTITTPSIVKHETEGSEDSSMLSHDRTFNGTGNALPSSPEDKPLTAFMTFCSLQRKIVQEKYLQLHGEEACRSELAKLFAQEWKLLSLEEKQVYVGITEARKRKTIKNESENNSAMAAEDTDENQMGVTMDFSDVTDVKVETDQQ